MARRNRQRTTRPRVPSVTLAASSPPSREAGWTGQPAWGGALLDSETDHVSAWQLPTRWATIEKMLGDPDINAVLWAMTLPLLSVQMDVRPGGEDELDREIAATLRRDLDNMTVSLQEHRLEALDFLAWGNRVFETVYERSKADGLWHLRKLALRPSETVARWLVDDAGGPNGVAQSRREGGEEILGMDRLVVFTHQRRGGDLTGRSVLRPAYRSWLISSELVRVGAAAVHRHGMGVPTVLYRGHDKRVADRYESLLAGIHSHAKAYALLTDLESIDDFVIRGVDGQIIDPVPQLEYHRRAVYTTTLAQFLLLGGEAIGSYALSSDHSSFFLLGLEAILGTLADTYNRYLIPRWVSYNWNIPADRMPEVTFGRLDRRDTKTWFETILLAQEAGVLETTEALKRQAAEMLDLPLPDEGGDPTVHPVPDVNRSEGDPASEAPEAEGAATMADRRESEVKIEALGIAVDFDRMERAMDAARAELTRRLLALQAKATRYVQRRVTQAVRDGDIEALIDLSIGVDREKDELVSHFLELYDLGVEEVGKEIASQGAKAPKPDGDRDSEDRSRLALLAAAFAAVLADRLKTAAVSAGAGQVVAGVGRAIRVEDTVTAPPDALLNALVMQGIGLALGAGRRAGIDAAVAGGVVERELYTTKMDVNVCDGCAPFDGRIYASDDPEKPAIPNPQCYGGDRCRCELVPIVGQAPAG